MILEQLRYLIALNNLPGIKIPLLIKMLEKYEDLSELFNKNDECLCISGTADWAAVEKDLDWMATHQDCYIITCLDKEYPPLLKEIADYPILLYIRGNLDMLHKPQIAMVGSRNPSAAGLDIAEQFSAYFSSIDLCVTSGLAIGIDTISHQAALPFKGGTIAVLGNGLDKIYPASNQSLSLEITQNGALVSEFSIGTSPISHHFPRRNRIISGLSLGTLVVEAALRSGSLITARFAMEQDREVFAIPGSLYNPQSKGCHQLIKQGAKLVDSKQDVMEELGSMFKFVNKNNDFQIATDLFCLPPLYKRVLSKLGFEATSIDTLARRSELTTQEISIMLLELELKGYIKSVPGGVQRNIKSP